MCKLYVSSIGTSSGYELHVSIADSVKEVHQRLASKIADTADIGWVPKPVHALGEAVSEIKSDHSFISNTGKVLFRYYWELGKLLEQLNRFHKDECLVEPWSKFLKEKCGLSDSYARKLRTIYNLLNGYSRFGAVAISFTEIYGMRNSIESMLKSEYGEYWK